MPATPKGRLIFARRRTDGATVGVHEVKNGRNCDCVCPECATALVAKQGRVRAHFAHVGGGGHGCGPGAWHEALCDAIASLNHIDFGRAPSLYRLRGPQRILRASKDRVLGGEYAPDVLLELQAGVTVAVEVVVTHDIDGLKLAAMQQECIEVLRIDAGVILKAMSAFPALRRNLVDLVGQFGPWQAWPKIHSSPVQQSLTLKRSLWTRPINAGLFV